MNSCSNCGKPLEEGALFCTFCGARQDPPPSPPEPVCPNCGAKLEPDSRFCGSCGACLQAEEGAGQALPVPVPAAPLPAAADGGGERADPPPIQPGGAKKRLRPAWIILPVLLVLLLAAAGFTGYRYFTFRNLMSEAESSAGDEDYDQAAALYQEALDRNPRSRDAALGLAEACLRQGRMDEASEALSGLDISEDSPLYPLYQTLTGVSELKPSISQVDAENFPVVAVTLEYGGGLRLTEDMVTLTEEGSSRSLTGFQAEDGKLMLLYETEDTDVSDEKRELSVVLDVEGFRFEREDKYRTPRFEPAQVRLVSTDVSEYPTVKAFFRVEDPATGNALEGLGQRSFIIRERLEGGEYLSREVHMVEPLAGNQGLNIGLLADKSSSITATDMGKFRQ